MHSAPDHDDWLDEVERRVLSAEELSTLRRQLASRPREATRLEEELALNRLLDGGFRPRASSNFTQRVLADLAVREPASRRSQFGGWARLRFPRFVLYATAALAMTIGWWQFQLHQRVQLAASVAEISRAAAVPGLALLQDFEAIQSFRAAPQPGDLALLAALNE